MLIGRTTPYPFYLNPFTNSVSGTKTIDNCFQKLDIDISFQYPITEARLSIKKATLNRAVPAAVPASAIMVEKAVMSVLAATSLTGTSKIRGCFMNRIKPTTSDTETTPLKNLTSSELFQGDRLLIIKHAGEEYRLSITSKDKLILTK